MRVTVPVGVGCPEAPATCTVNVIGWPAAIVFTDGVSVTVGIGRAVEKLFRRLLMSREPQPVTRSNPVVTV